MHVRPVSKKGGPLRGAIREDWGVYEDSWFYLILFLIASVFVPQKL